MPKDFLTPVTRTTLTRDVCRKLATHLIRGDWRPGERIPAERELCQKLGVGRASLREALKALEIMGMIETRLGDGTYACNRSDFFSRPLLWAITSSSLAEAAELVEARRLIEVEMAGMAASRATADDLKNIATELDRMAQSMAKPEDFLQSDIGFHLAVGQAAYNQILFNALHLIRNLLRQWISSALQVEGIAARALEQHKRIFMAIAKRDVAEARNSMEAHLMDMASVLVPLPTSDDELAKEPDPGSVARFSARL